MSNQQHIDAIHECLGTPIFVEEFIELRLLFDQSDYAISKRTIQDAIQSVESFKKIETFKTMDNYCWFAGIEFEIGDNTIIIAVPWAQDFKRSDNTQTDRAFAVYATYGIDNQIIIDLIRIVVANLKKNIGSNQTI